MLFACLQMGNEEQTTLMEGLLFQTTYILCKESKNSPVHYVAFEGNLFQINACVAHGGWVPRNLGTGAADPKPRLQEHPKSLPYPQPSHEPRPPYPAPAQESVTRSQKLRGNNNNSKNQ